MDTENKGINYIALAWAVGIPVLIIAVVGTTILWWPAIFAWVLVGLGIFIYFAVSTNWWRK